VNIRDIGVGIGEIYDFSAEYEGAWQRLPPALLAKIARDQPAVIVKFGLSLLRVPPATDLAAPILSYHHGDPDLYRGRPAGFYELYDGRTTMGQIVQILSNSLDAGKVVAFAETKVFPHSYRATLIEAFKRSPLLLKQAIGNAVAGTVLPKSSEGRNYRLPGNMIVAKLCARVAWAMVRRLAYGALVEKAWQVSTADFPAELAAVQDTPFPPPSCWNTLVRPASYNFLADPFFAPDGRGLLVEALHARSGKGEILRIEGDEARSLSEPSCHHSYPGGISLDGAHYLVPEVSLWARQRIYRLADDGLAHAGDLQLGMEERLLDPTLLDHDGRIFLFANIAEEGSGVLRLWHAPSLFDRFEEHPASPLLISPAGSRMAGAIVRAGGSLLRFGQDFRGEYGDGLIVFRIAELNVSAYRETQVRALRLEGVKGPHTMNFQGGSAAFDWYRDRFSLLAGVRRLRGLRHGAKAGLAGERRVNLIRQP